MCARAGKIRGPSHGPMRRLSCPSFRTGKEDDVASFPRELLGVVLAVTVLSSIGCSSSDLDDSRLPSTASRHPPGRLGSDPAERGKSGKLLAELAHAAGRAGLSGEMDGYLEPCGCTQGQLGGLIRRLDFVERPKAQNWPVALIDLGSLIKDPAAARGGASSKPRSSSASP